MGGKRYARRSSAVRAAKSACKKALDASAYYQAAERVDFIILVHDWLRGPPEQLDDEYSFALIGVCLEAAKAKEKDPAYVYQP